MFLFNPTNPSQLPINLSKPSQRSPWQIFHQGTSLHNCLHRWWSFFHSLDTAFGWRTVMSLQAAVFGTRESDGKIEHSYWNPTKNQTSWCMRRQSLRYDDIHPQKLLQQGNTSTDYHLLGSMLDFQGCTQYIFSLGCSLTMTLKAANFTQVTIFIGRIHMQSLVWKSCMIWRYHTITTHLTKHIHMIFTTTWILFEEHLRIYTKIL